MVNLRRILQPTIIKNEKDVTYEMTSFSRQEVISLLEQGDSIGGIFGLELTKSLMGERLTTFFPITFKNKYKPIKRDKILDSITSKDTTFINITTNKNSLFPLNMNCKESIWSIICSVVPNHIQVTYQLLLSYRQDNWRERLEEMYEFYLNDGLEYPSDKVWLRHLQRNINEKIDSIVKYKHTNTPIAEVEQKLKEHGFRYSMRVILTGSTKRERLKVVKKLRDKIDALSYVNSLRLVTPAIVGDVINDIEKRKLDNITKNDVLSVSELISLMTTNEAVHIEKESIKVNDITRVVDKKDTRLPDTQNTSLIDLLPKGSDHFKEVDTESLAKQFSKALKRLKEFKGELVCNDAIVGTTLIKLFFSLPKNIKFSDLTKKATIDDLKMYSGFKHLEISQSDKVGEFVVSLPMEERRKVYLGDLLSDERFVEFSKTAELGFIAGVSTEGEVLMRDLAKGRHLLIGSETGGGKSSFINQLLLTLLLTKRPSEVQMYMIDPKLVELEMYRKFKHVAKIVNNANEGILLLQQVCNEMNSRYELFQRSGVKDIIQYNEKYPNNKIPYLLIVIDEYSELSLFNKDVHDYVISISQLGRASGCVLILSTQDPRKEVIPPLIKSNMPSKIAFRCSNRYSYQTFLPKQPPKLYGQGHGVLCFTNQLEDFIEFQSCLITDGNEVELVEGVAKRMNYDDVQYELPEVEEVEEESDIDKLKRCIVQNNETRISQIQKLLRMNINKITDMMKILCEEGFLEKGRSRAEGYKLIANENEIEKWR